MEEIARKEGHIYIRDHKENFKNNPQCRLINLEKRKVASLANNTWKPVTLQSNEWHNSQTIIEWFENISREIDMCFISDIIDSYPSIAEELLTRVLAFAQENTVVSNNARHSILLFVETVAAENGKYRKGDIIRFNPPYNATLQENIENA